MTSTTTSAPTPPLRSPAPALTGDSITMPFLRNTWYVVGWSDEFHGPGPYSRTVIDCRLVLYRTTDSTLVALHDRCPHRWAPLSKGRVEGDSLRCMYHGLRFDQHGQCVEVPGQSRIAPSLCIPTIPLIERHRLAWVWLGDAAHPDPEKIPDLSMLEQTWRRIYFGSIDYEANYALINDNLLDLSHISFLHAKSVGRPVATEDEGANVQPYIPGGAASTPLKNGVRVESWVCGPAARSVLVPRGTPTGDLWTRTDFLVPGIFISVDRMFIAGTAMENRDRAPPEGITALSDVMSIQAVTPISRRSTRYFFSFGPRSSDLPPSESEQMWAIVQETFREDLQMIQEQQKIIDIDSGGRMGGIAADRGLTFFRKMMNNLLLSERKHISQFERPSHND